MKKFGLVGYPLSHSFSKGYFSEKFEKEKINDCIYDNYEIEHADELVDILKDKEIKGLNVTIPHKEAVMKHLDSLHSAAERIGAVNVINVEKDGTVKGYNSDYFGFLESLKQLLKGDHQLRAFVFGSGGASKAVLAALEDLKIPFQLVSRKATNKAISYENIDTEAIKSHRLLINTTPLGMSPKVETYPNIPYEAITNKHYVFDLVYNPATTLFMQKAINNGAKVKNGLDMLHLQAEKAWEIWNR